MQHHLHDLQIYEKTARKNYCICLFYVNLTAEQTLATFGVLQLVKSANLPMVPWYSPKTGVLNDESLFTKDSFTH